MKKLFITGIVMSATFCLSAAHAGGEMQAWGLGADTTFYLGGGLGAANQSDYDDGNTGAGKIYGGIRYRSIGAELGYLKVGEAETGGEMARDPSFKSDTSALTAAAVGYLPVAARTELLGKLGAVYWNQDNTNEVELTGVRSESDDSGLSPLLGIGAQYRLYQNVNLRGEWEHIFSTGDGDYESDIDVLTVGVSMSTL